MQWISIIVLSILATVSYGIIHDQITARICIEYFTVGHSPIVMTNDPTLLGLVWGVAATWWVGIILGIPLAIVARIGTRPKVTASSLIRPIAVLWTCCAATAFFAGLAGYLAASVGWVWLVGSIANLVPKERHVSFLVDLWAHNASYMSGFVGGVLLMVWVWRSRNNPSKSRELKPDA